MQWYARADKIHITWQRLFSGAITFLPLEKAASAKVWILRLTQPITTRGCDLYMKDRFEYILIHLYVVLSDDDPLVTTSLNKKEAGCCFSVFSVEEGEMLETGLVMVVE